MTLADPPGTPRSGYGAGLVVSLAAHLAAAALIVTLLHPKPVTDQPTPKSQIQIETQSVRQSQPKPQTTSGTKAQTDAPKGQSAAEGSIPQNQVKAATLPQTAAKAQTPAGTALSQAAPPTPAKALTLQATALAPAAAPPLTKALPPPSTLAAETPPATATQASALPSQTVAEVTGPRDNLAGAALPIQTVAAAAAPAETLTARPPPPPVQPSVPVAETLTSTTNAAQIASTTPQGDTAPQATPDAHSLTAASVTGQQMTAILAWAGETGTIDPVSLQAVASFMRPGDTAAQADDVHDGLSAILHSAPCSRLQAEFNPATGSLDLRGHVPDEGLKAPLLAALQAQLGSGIKVNDAMVILPRPQCGALSGIADVGLPQSQGQLTSPKLIGPDAQARTFDYTQGQPMVLDLSAPDYDAYVYVDFFAADGRVIHLVPNDTVPLKLRPAKSTLHVGAPDAGQPYLHITIGPPYGQEIVAAFAASAPLYDGNRPLTEPATVYLDWLKTRVTEARAKDKDFKGEWVYFMVSTKEK